MLELRLVKEMRNLAIFRWFLDAFASWMRVYMFCIEKVSKMGLFWLSLFLFILALFRLTNNLVESICFWLWDLECIVFIKEGQEKRENVRESRD